MPKYVQINLNDYQAVGYPIIKNSMYPILFGNNSYCVGILKR
jgi:hypothetical protein